MHTEAGTTRCPQCAQQIPADPRYLTWCDKCDWNVNPTATENPQPAWRQRLEHRLADTLYRELEHGAIHRPGWDAARIGAYLLSGLVLLLPLAALLAGITLLVFYRPLWLSILLALIPLSLALLLHPRAHHLDPDAQTVQREQAPTLFALRSSQRAEYLADRKAAEIAGSDATAWALERTLLADASYRALERALRYDKGIAPLEAVRRAVTEVPAREIERRVRVSRLEDTRIDSTHPPTYLRTRLIRTRPAQHARVVLSNDRSHAIDRELAPTADAVLKELRAEFPR